MDYENTPSPQEDESWLDSILDTPPLSGETEADADAVMSAGLLSPDELDLERIIAETKAGDWGNMPEAESSSPAAELPTEAPEAVAAEPVPAAEAPTDVPAAEPVPAQVAEAPEAEPTVSADATQVVPAVLPIVGAAAASAEEIPDVTPTAGSGDVSALDRAELDEIGFDPTVFDEPEFQEPQDADFFLAAAFDEPAANEGTQPFDSNIPWEIPELDTGADPTPQESPEETPATEETPHMRKDRKKKTPEGKVRPKMKKNYGLFGLPHLAASIIWLAIIVGIGVSLGTTLWVCAAEVLAFGKQPSTVTITITQDDMDAEDTLERVAKKLEYAGLIDYPELFLWYANLTEAEEEIMPGTYVLRGTDDYMALVNSMNSYSSSRETVEVMIPEGYTCAQIFALLEQKGVCEAEELERYAAEGELKEYWFLEGVERGTKYCLEGYLFPDTYEFYVGDDPGRVITKMLGDSVGGFDVRFTDIMEEKLKTLNETLSKMMKKNGYGQDYIDAHQMTIREVVIIASMIEKETTGADRYDISSVIYNRLTNARNHPYLNIDATILYALGGKVDPITGENMPLTEADMKLDSPFNTYLYKGLPPGPIANPGVYSLLAALDPNDTAYYYYVYDPSIRAHHFSKTYEEHQRYIDKMGG